MDPLPADGLRPPAHAAGDRPGRLASSSPSRSRSPARATGRSSSAIRRRRLDGGALATLTSPYPLRLRYDRGTLRAYFSFSWPLLARRRERARDRPGRDLIGDARTSGWRRRRALARGRPSRSSPTASTRSSRGTIYPAICAVRDRTELLYESFVKSNRLALMWALPFGVGLTLFADDLVHFVLGDALGPRGAAAAGPRRDRRARPPRLQLGRLLPRPRRDAAAGGLRRRRVRRVPGVRPAAAVRRRPRRPRRGPRAGGGGGRGRPRLLPARAVPRLPHDRPRAPGDRAGAARRRARARPARDGRPRQRGAGGRRARPVRRGHDLRDAGSSRARCCARSSATCAPDTTGSGLALQHSAFRCGQCKT